MFRQRGYRRSNCHLPVGLKHEVLWGWDAVDGSVAFAVGGEVDVAAGVVEDGMGVLILGFPARSGQRQRGPLHRSGRPVDFDGAHPFTRPAVGRLGVAGGDGGVFVIAIGDQLSRPAGGEMAVLAPARLDWDFADLAGGHVEAADVGRSAIGKAAVVDDGTAIAFPHFMADPVAP